MKIKKNRLSITSKRVIDNNIHVDILFYGLRFTIEFQKINNQLVPSKRSIEYLYIESICQKRNIKFDDLLKYIKKEIE